MIPDLDANGPAPIYAEHYRTRPLSAVDTLVLHYVGLADDAEVNGLVTARYQTGPKDRDQYPAIAYHYGFLPNGDVEWYHDLDVRTWGVANHNDHTVHCIVYGVGLTGRPNEAQQESILWLWQAIPKDIYARYAWDIALALKGHREVGQSECPGPGIISFIREVRGEA